MFLTWGKLTIIQNTIYTHPEEVYPAPSKENGAAC